MKKILKIFIYFILTIFTLVIVLIIVSKLAENKITDIAMKKVSETIKAPVSIDNVSFNLLRKFPLASIELNGVWLGSPKENLLTDSSSQKTDTIVSINKIYVSVKSKPLIDGIIEIMKVDVDGANLFYKVDTSGVTNIDFLMSETDTTVVDTTPAEPLYLTLTDLSMKNITCNFSDKSLKTAAKIGFPELKVKAKVEGDDISASVKGGMSLTNCSFEATNLHLMKKTEIDFDIDYINDSVSIKLLDINTDGASLNLLGSVLLGDEIETDVKFEGSNLMIDELIKYAPEDVLKEFGVNKVSGKMNLNAVVKGTVSDSDLPRVDATIKFENGNVVTRDYPALNNISFNGKITNGVLRNNQSTNVVFDAFHFETAKSKFDISFSLLDIDHPKYDVNTEMEINVGEFRKFIPDTLVQYIDGDIKATLSTRGELPDSIGDDFVDYIMANSKANVELSNFNIEMDSVISIKSFSTQLAYKPNNFRVNNLYISLPEYKVKLKNTSLNAHFKGSINNTAGMSLDLKSYHIETGKSVFSGFAKVKNFDRPDYSFSSRIMLNLDEVKTMLPDSIVNQLGGEVSAEIKSSGVLNLDSIAEQAMDIVFNRSSFKFNFNNMLVETFDYPLYTLKDFDGIVEMNREAITINKMKGNAAGIEFGIDSTIIENVYNTVLLNKKEQLTVDTRISLGDLDYAMFSAFMPTDTTATDSSGVSIAAVEPEQLTDTTEAEPTNFSMLIKGGISVNSFQYEKAFIENISTLFKITDSVYIADQLKFKAFEGNMNSAAKYTIKPDGKNIIELHNIIDRMNVKKLLVDFDNFKDYYEPSITHENLSGLFSTDLYSRFVMVGDSMIEKDMRIKGDIKLEDGGVYDFEPATDLAKFTRINELDNIQFKTLESNIFMFKGKMYVPTTHIVSTALDISAYGMQSLGEDYEYHLQIHLGDVLKGKSKKLLKEQAESGEDVKEGDIDRNSVNIIYSQIDGKSKTGFDTKKLQSKMKTKIRVQEAMLDLIFHPGMFSFETDVYSNNDIIKK